MYVVRFTRRSYNQVSINNDGDLTSLTPTSKVIAYVGWFSMGGISRFEAESQSRDSGPRLFVSSVSLQFSPSLLPSGSWPLVHHTAQSPTIRHSQHLCPKKKYSPEPHSRSPDSSGASLSRLTARTSLIPSSNLPSIPPKAAAV